MTASTLPSIELGASELRGEGPLLAWRDAIAPLFEVDLLDQRINCFRVDMATHHLGSLLLAEVSSVSQSFRRSSNTIARSGVDHYLVQLYRDGGYAGKAGRADVRVQAGDLSVLDMSRPVETTAADFRAISLVVPRLLLAPLVRCPAGLHGLVLPGRSARGRLLADHLLSLRRRVAELTLEEASALAPGICALIAGCVGAAADAREQVGTDALDACLVNIQLFIDAHLASPDLTPKLLMRRFGLSRAKLYRLFEPTGGVMAYIRERRLQRCMRELCATHNCRRRIADIAYEWGFADEASFSRSFRRTFGSTPREVRDGERRRNGMARAAVARSCHDLSEWIRKLKIS